MIVGFQVRADRPASPTSSPATASCSRTCSIACAARAASSAPTQPRRRRRPTPARRHRRRASIADAVADPVATSIVIPAFNEGAVDRRRRRGAAARPRRGTRSSSSTTDRPTTPARTPRPPARAVVRHPYNKGNGAAVKSGIRAATGEYVLILDGDGQHQPEDARRLVVAARRVRSGGRRARRGDAGDSGARRVGNARSTGSPSYLTGRADSRPDVRLPRGAARAACASSCTCCRTASRRRRRPRWRSSGRATTWRSSRSRRGSGRALEDPAGARRRQVLPHHAADRSRIFSPLRIFLPISVSAFLLGLVYAAWNLVTDTRIPNGAVLLMMFAVIVFLVGLVSEQISALRAAGRE